MNNIENNLEQYDSRKDTLEHIQNVGIYIDILSGILRMRKTTHDVSKTLSPEKEIFDIYTPKLKTTEYGSDEYYQSLKEMKVALDHHYEENSHHPEYYPNGISGMNLIDLCEMICDWLAASKRHNDGDIYKSIEINQERFKYGDDLKNILINTIRCLETNYE